MNEINESYKNCKSKKEKEVLCGNIKATLEAIHKNIEKSKKAVDD